MDEQTLKNFSNKISQGAGSEAGYRLTRRFMNPNKVIKPTMKNKMRAGLYGAASSAVLNPIISKLILKNKKLSLPWLLTDIVSGFATGYISPDVVNYIKKEKEGKISSSESREKIKDLEADESHVRKKSDEIINLYADAFSKKAGLVSGTARMVGKTIKGSTGLLWKGINPRSGLKRWQKTPFHRKALKYGVRGTLGAGVTYGGYKAVQNKIGPRSKNNYTTLLRNNVLAGNVQPSELSQQDLISVRKLGLR